MPVTFDFVRPAAAKQGLVINTSTSSLNNTSVLSGGAFAFGVKLANFTNETAHTELSDISGNLQGVGSRPKQ